MKQLGFLIGFFIIILTILPAIVVLRVPINSNFTNSEDLISQNNSSVETFSDTYKDLENKNDLSSKITVYIKNEDVVKEFDLEEYLVYVILAEMPASYEMEALKAQAVAARTYIVNKMVNGNYPDEHKGAAVCTDYAHCKAYISEDEAKKRFGDNFNIYFSKIKEAVEATKDEILVYNNEPILAVFHAQSHGKTENASDVWGGDYPYLVSVESPGDNHISYATYTFEDFKSRIEKENSNAKIFSTADIKNPVLSEGGAVKTINIGGVDFKGTEIRSIFNLKSHAFSIGFNDDKVVFTVKGYGHCVGMSQNGANTLAKEGKTYENILKTYYSGVNIIKNEDRYYYNP